ncbi:serine hydrolase domain-containing protein [Cryptosporangium aurantiacum]|uniref:CubicO group peptidase, beta-lactamase class C family n=1 Tax=Cryptosporangium aurantiacum TaxID=134849 RepID=A0A1M7RNK4_9ACTN|nr:serine hydrolase domain-containing protein [Cryptosporangium aurantiacum]SHN47638.1 CubicO group peptidase, beta-lactamase class C family [Cryptosporangium aurantiacum]
MRTLLVALLLIATLTACTDDTGPEPAPRESVGQCDAGLHAAFSAWTRAGFSGSVAISTKGRFDCLAGFGSANDSAGTPNTPDTVFSIGSVTKSFTAATVFHLVDAGKLSLDDPAGRLLPELAGPVAGVTVEQLLLHTSGLNGSHGEDHQPLSRNEAITAINRLELAFPPGTDYVYSNAGYTLLALIIEKVSGSSYRDYTATNILPLPGRTVAGGFWDGEPAAPGPRAVGYTESGAPGHDGTFAGPHWAVDGNGALAMTARDLAAWTHELFTGRLVSPASVRAISTPGHDLGNGQAETPGWAAVDASAYGKPFLTASGGGGDVGHNAVVAWVPERQQAIVVMSNKPRLPAGKLLKTLAPALISGHRMPTPGAPPADADTAARVGTYRLATGGSLDVSASGNRLVMSARGTDAVIAALPPRDLSTEDIRDHERRVLAVLRGESSDGRTERKLFESDYGPITDIALAGTVFHDNDVRTYVTISTRSRSVLGWFSVDEKGGVGAVEVPTEPPSLALVPSGNGRYRPDDPTETGPEVTVEFADDRMTVTTPRGTTVARRAG